MKPAMIHNGPVDFEIESVNKNFNVSSLKDEQKEAAIHLLRLKEGVAILQLALRKF